MLPQGSEPPPGATWQLVDAGSCNRMFPDEISFERPTSLSYTGDTDADLLRDAHQHGAKWRMAAVATDRTIVAISEWCSAPVAGSAPPAPQPGLTLPDAMWMWARSRVDRSEMTEFVRDGRSRPPEPADRVGFGSPGLVFSLGCRWAYEGGCEVAKGPSLSGVTNLLRTSVNMSPEAAAFLWAEESLVSHGAGLCSWQRPGETSVRRAGRPRRWQTKRGPS